MPINEQPLAEDVIELVDWPPQEPLEKFEDLLDKLGSRTDQKKKPTDK